MRKINSKLKPIYNALIEQGFILFIPILTIKIFDLYIFNTQEFTGEFGTFSIFGIIALNELIFLCFYLITVGLILSLIKKLSTPIYWFLTVLFSLIIIFIYLVSSQYYLTSYLFLDHVILYFTFSELLEIASSEAGRLSHQYFWYYLLPFLLFISLLIFNKKILSKIFASKVLKTVVALLLVIIGINFITKNPKLTEKQKSIVTSKPKYLFTSIFNHLLKKNELENLSNKDFLRSVKEFREFMGWKASSYQTEFPFSRILDLDENSLNPYFKTFENAPNVVIIFCEGLSSTFSGPDATLGSLTPNLDALFSQSLYWPNTISNTDRTHGVFANALASLPHGYERGMLNLKSTFPHHLSIPKLLVSNRYTSSFTYGGWGYFDNFEPFLRMNYIKNIRDKTYIEKEGIYTLEKEENQFTWGFHDKKMVDLYFDFKDTSKAEPFLDIFITLSLHSPFDIPEREKYEALAIEKLKHFDKESQLFNRYKEVVAAILYQDDALNTFMNAYKKRPEYENTIFLFVGDHNVNTLPLRSELDSHFVPLAIFSPKLKESKQFKDIVAHTDIPYSLLSILKPYLSEKQIPKYTNWVGNGLTTLNKTSTKKPLFIGRFNGDIFGVIFNDIVLMDEKLYQVDDQLNLSKIKDEKKKVFLEKQIVNYRIMNRYVIDDLKLLIPKDTLEYPNKEAVLLYQEQ